MILVREEEKDGKEGNERREKEDINNREDRQ